MNKLMLADSSGEKSLTATAFIIGFIVVNLKLLFSGITILNFTVSAFGGGEYAAAMAALGGIYVLRRNFGSTGNGTTGTEENK